MIRPTKDAARLNAIANHPEVRPHIGGGTAQLDFTQVLTLPHVLALEVEHGAFVFAALDPGRYEQHTLILPEGRGAGVLPAAREAFRYMFVQTDCTEIVTKVAGSNKAAALMARRAGFAQTFTRPNAWEDGSDLTFFSLSMDAWRAHDDQLSAEGHAFHEALEAAKLATGSALAVHPDDDAHDRAAGAAVLMGKAGNVEKACWSYNRWARLAGYATIELVPGDPPIVDIRDALITFRNGELEIVQCR